MSNNDWKSRLGMVYSTSSDFEYTTQEDEQQQELPPAKQKLRVALDRRNRRGKSVTLVADFIGSQQSLEELCKRLKQRLGVGGSAKDGEIIIQGDHRDKIVEILTADGYKARKI